MNLSKNVKRKIKFIVVILLTATLIPLTAEAIPYSFLAATFNGKSTPEVARQYYVEIQSNSKNVTFSFYNLGLISSSMTDSHFYINFDFFINPSIENSQGVSFSQINPQSHILGGSSFNFDTAIYEFSADSEDNGVNLPDEFLHITFDLTDKKYRLTDLKDDILNRNFIIGLQVQLQNSEGKTVTDYLINKPRQMIPEPSLIILLGSLIIGAGWFSRKRFIK